MYIHTVEKKVTTSEQRQIASSVAYEGGSKIGLDLSGDEEIPIGATDYEVKFTLDVSAIKSIFILADQDVTLETNSGAAPDNTLALKAGVPYEWQTGSYFDNKLTVDVTALFFTNASGVAVDLALEAITDPTP